MRKKKLIKASLLIAVMMITPCPASAAVDNSVPAPIAPQTLHDSTDIPDNVAVDADGNPYPEGGPSGLYEAIEDKQAQLKGAPNNKELNNALNRLRTNMEKLLEKREISMEPEPGIEGKLAQVNNPYTPDNPNNVAVDADGKPYPEGGPSGLYEAIEDKQAQLKGDPGNKGLNNALNRLRTNMEKLLEKREISMAPGPGIEVRLAQVNNPYTPDNPDNVAVDADGNPYPEGGPSGLYEAIEDKQAQLKGDPDNKGLNNALNRLRTNMEKLLEKREISMGPGPGIEVKLAQVEKTARLDRGEKPTKIEKPVKPERPAKPERLSKPEKPVRPEKPSKPSRPGK